MRTLTSLLAIAALLVALPVAANTGKDKKGPPKKQEGGIKALGDVVSKCRKHEGLFTLYQDTATGALYLLVKKSQLDRDYLHFSQAADGNADAGYFRGAYLGERLFRMERWFERVEVKLRNTAYRFDAASPLSKAGGANINEPVLVSEKIEAANAAQDSLLIKADALLLGEGLQQIKYPPPPGWPPGAWFDIGNLDKDRTKVRRIRNYPMNTDVETEYVFTNPYPQNYGSASTTDARAITIRMHHSLIELPQNDFRPRYDDPRVGYFTTQVSDMTTPEAVNYRDLVHRWHLVKKDPAATISEPVEPITWWIENTTPHEFRSAIKAGAEAWNLAFEKCGFKNALVVKEQPDDADWDAGDVRYNVLRWTSSPEPPFGGYGPSFVDPRTGQILGADIMLEYVFVTNRLRESEVFQTAGMGYMAMPDHLLNDPKRACFFAHDLHSEVMFGTAALDAMGLGDVEKKRFLQEALRDLVLHEVGHTLGLMHNMKSSSIHTPEQMADRAFTEEHALAGSVMDYAPSNLPLDPAVAVQYFETKPGPYDDWAIAFGYTSLPDAGAEAIKVKEILARSTEPDLLFGNDADDMRSPGHGIDPRTMIFDHSSDPVAFALRTITIADRTLGGLKQRYTTGDRSYQELLNAYLWSTGRKFTSANVITRQIGGIYLDRSFTSQTTSTAPFTPVPYATQKKAMKALAEHAFAPTAFTTGNDLLPWLQWQRRGFDHFGWNEDPRVHDRVFFAQRAMLAHLLNPATLRRLVDSEAYGNGYKLTEMITDLTDACFQADKAGAVNTYRQNLQQHYVERLIDMAAVDSWFANQARSMAVYELERIRKGLNLTVTDKATLAHRTALKLAIDRALSTR